MMIKRLLVPIDGGDLAPRTIEASLALAKQLGAAIVGFVVEPLVPLPSPGVHATPQGVVASVEELRSDEHAQRLLKRFEDRAGLAGVAFEGHYLHTREIDAAIVEAAQQHRCDLIVMVTHGRGVVSRLVVGSHTQKVLARSVLPVLVMH